jgi:AhpD family alkylhydroperoxidase
MNPRLNYVHAAPDAARAMNALQAQAEKTNLDKQLLELVRMRVSQINGCAFCLDMHSKDALAGPGDRAVPELHRGLRLKARHRRLVGRAPRRGRSDDLHAARDRPRLDVKAAGRAHGRLADRSRRRRCGWRRALLRFVEVSYGVACALACTLAADLVAKRVVAARRSHARNAG